MNWQTLFDPAFSSRLCLTLLHSIWQFAVLAVVIWCLNLIWKNQSVERRYSVNLVALLMGIAALPVTFLVIKSAEVRVEAVTKSQIMATTANSPSEPRISTPDESTFVVPAEAQTVEPPIERAENNTANNTSFAAHSPGGTLHRWLQITPWIAAFYVLGVGFMLARLIVSMIKVHRLSRQATVIKDGPLVESLRSLANQWTMKMVPVLAQAEHIIVPTVIGLLRPLILLPASVVSGLTPDELEMILAHELAHVRRYDMWVNLLQRLSEAVLFFNPALWYLSRQISGLREFCCDELTCREHAESDFERKVRYATALLRVVELSKPNLATNPELTSLAANGHSPSEVRRRVARLFGEPLREPLRLTRGMIYAMLVLLLIGGPALWSTYAEKTTVSQTDQQEPETTPESVPSKSAPIKKSIRKTPASTANAVISGRIVLEDGSPATTKGYLYYESKNGSNSRQSTVGQFVDQFSTKPPPGTIWLRYFPEGYAPALVGPLKLKPGEQRNDISIVLKPGFTHLLRMQNQKQELITGATVVVHPGWNGNVHGPIQKQTVNEQGELLLEHLADTNYSIKVTAPGYEPLYVKSQDLRSLKETTLSLTASQKTTGVIQDPTGKPMENARLFLKHEITNEGRSLGYAGSKNGFWGELIATTDAQGRFELDQLTKDSHYLCVVEAENGARAIIHDLQAGQHTSIVVPERRDLIVNISGDLSKLPQRRGKPFVSVRQRVDFHPVPDSRFGELIGADTPVEVTDDGATAIFRGLAVDLNAGNKKQQVSVSLNYPSGPVQTVDIDPNQETRVEFDLSQLPPSENKGTPPVPKAEGIKTMLPDDQVQKKINADTSIPVKPAPAAKLSFVIAKHVILLEGKEIITWEEIDDFLKTLPDTSLIRPAFYFTRGTMVSDGYQPAKAKMWELTRKFKFAGHSEGSLWPRTDFRYDKIKTVADLKSDPQNKLTGTIVDQQGTPVDDAEVALILPVDESIGYKTYHVALVLGQIRNRLEHVMTISDSSGQFDLYPPQDQKYFILAMHPEAGFSLVRSDQIQADKKIKLLPWAGLKTELDEVPNETQTVDLTNQVEADQGWPAISFTQYWSDLPQEAQDRGFVYNQIPPLSQATINRSFKQPDGGGISLPGASVNMMPGEKRELGLGPLSEQQRLQLERMRDFSRRRQNNIEKKAKDKAN